MRERRLTERPKAMSGSTIAGIANRTRLESLGLVITIMITAPTPMMELRSATEAVAPTADLICVASAASRDTISPECDLSKNAGDSSATCAKTSRLRSDTTRSPTVMTKKYRAAEASASTTPITTSMPKYCDMKPESPPPKPWSIIRRTASGKVSVIAAASTSAAIAAATMPL